MSAKNKPPRVLRSMKARDQRKADFAALFREHGEDWTLQQYGEALGLHLATIWKYLQELESEWQEQRIEDVDAVKQEIIERIRWRIREATEAWEKSKDDAEESVAEKIEGAGGKGHTKAIKKRRGQTGDPRYLSAIKDAEDQLRGLLGLDPPKKDDAKDRMADAMQDLADAAQREADDKLRDAMQRRIVAAAMSVGAENGGDSHTDN